jgi:hypothetical protein
MSFPVVQEQYFLWDILELLVFQIELPSTGQQAVMNEKIASQTISDP